MPPFVTSPAAWSYIFIVMDPISQRLAPEVEQQGTTSSVRGPGISPNPIIHPQKVMDLSTPFAKLFETSWPQQQKLNLARSFTTAKTPSLYNKPSLTWATHSHQPP